jgi:hypothetical protein
MVNVIFDYQESYEERAKQTETRHKTLRRNEEIGRRESTMPNELTLALGFMAVATVALACPIPRIEVRRHSETRNGMRVREIGLTWLRRSPADPKAPRSVECAVYVTLTICNQ